MLTWSTVWSAMRAVQKAIFHTNRCTVSFDFRSMLHHSRCLRSLQGRAAQVAELLQGPHGTKVDIAYEPAGSTKDKVPPSTSVLTHIFPSHLLCAVFCHRLASQAARAAGGGQGRQDAPQHLRHPHSHSAPLSDPRFQQTQTTLAAPTPTATPSCKLSSSCSAHQCHHH